MYSGLLVMVPAMMICWTNNVCHDFAWWNTHEGKCIFLKCGRNPVQ